MDKDFEILGKIEAVETIAVGRGIRELHRLRALFGKARWRKLKGIAVVEYADGTIQRVELHWYEAWFRQKGNEDQSGPRLSND